MRLKLFVTALLATALPMQHAAAQGTTMMVPVGGSNPPPVSQPPAPSDDTPEEIAEDAARDLRDTRFYNRPGATRADYDRDWQECRLIARGSRTPSGTVPYYYNPAVISPLAAGIGAGIGGLIAGAIAEGQQRRANRRNCLLIRGWRLVEVPATDAARVRDMTDAERGAYFETIVGASQVNGSITERTSFALAPDPALRLQDPIEATGTLSLGRRVDPAIPLVLAPGEGAVVLAFRRPDQGSAGRSGTVEIARYDPAIGDLIYQPRDWRRRADTTTYRMSVGSQDRRAPYEVHVLKATPGDYVVTGLAVGRSPVTTSFCFGAPTFHVAAGEVVYIGDFVPYMDAELSTGEKVWGIAYTSHIEEARRALAVHQAALAEGLTPATLRNRATYACSAINMDRWDLPGVPALERPEAAMEVATPAEAVTSEGAASPAAADAAAEAGGAATAEAPPTEGPSGS